MWIFKMRQKAERYTDKYPTSSLGQKVIILPTVLVVMSAGLAGFCIICMYYQVLHVKLISRLGPEHTVQRKNCATHMWFRVTTKVSGKQMQ